MIQTSHERNIVQNSCKENIAQPSSGGNNIVQNSYKEDFVQYSLLKSQKKVAGSDLNFRQMIRRGENYIHFMNACRLENSFYTCAVGSFLEVAFATFSSSIKEIETRTLFLTIC